MILVDDASTDEGETWRLITEFESRYPDNCVAIHLKENRHQGGAENAGLQYAKGEYITFTDSDDWLEEDMYWTLYEYAQKRHCDIVNCRMRWEFQDESDAGCNATSNAD